MSLTLEQMRAAIGDNRILSQITDEAILPASNLSTLLQSVVDRETQQAASTRKLKELLEARPEERPASPAEFGKAVKEFIEEAKSAYRRIGTSAASIANGEMRALAHNTLGPLTFGADPNENVRQKNRLLRGIPLGGSNNELAPLMFATHIEDAIEAMEFLKTEIELVMKAVKKEKDDFKKILDNAIVPEKGPALNYIEATKAYIGVLGKLDLLDESIDDLTACKFAFEHAIDSKSRKWGYELVKGMGNFGKFLCNFAAAESDLLALEGITARGPMQKAAIQMLRHVIVTDEKLYSQNNQIPIPPPSGRLPDISSYFDAYIERQEALVGVGADRVNAINTKFDRRINIANKRYLMLNESKYTYVPYKPSFALDRMDLTDVVDMTEYTMRGGQMVEGYDAGMVKVPDMEEVSDFDSEGLPPPVKYIPPPPPPPPSPRTASERALDKAGLGAMIANPRKK